jgi:ABC-type multidrug transport system permease subunit
MSKYQITNKRTNQVHILNLQEKLNFYKHNSKLNYSEINLTEAWENKKDSILSYLLLTVFTYSIYLTYVYSYC